MEQEDITRPVGQKIQSDTEQQVNQFSEARRRDRVTRSGKIKLQVQTGSQRSPIKEIRLGEAYSTKADQPDETTSSLLILLGLGLTLSLVNDFSDLVTWQSAILVGQAVDIVALLLLIFTTAFASKAHFISVFIIFFAFILEILPVIGVVPWWTMGIIALYIATKRK